MELELPHQPAPVELLFLWGLIIGTPLAPKPDAAIFGFWLRRQQANEATEHKGFGPSRPLLPLSLSAPKIHDLLLKVVCDRMVAATLPSAQTERRAVPGR
jgi:hypothetical protein